VNEHPELFAISDPFRNDGAAASSHTVSWPNGLTNEQLFSHLLGIASEANGAASLSMRGLDLSSSADSTAAELADYSGLFAFLPFFSCGCAAAQAKKKQRKRNLIGENPAQPCALNEPVRLVILKRKKDERERAEEEKKERKKKKMEKKKAREEATSQRSQKKQEKMKKEEPIVRALVELGFQKKEKRPTVKDMAAFLKANKMSCVKAHPSPEQLMARLLERLSLPPPAGGWRGLHAAQHQPEHEQEDKNERKKEKDDDEEEETEEEEEEEEEREEEEEADAADGDEDDGDDNSSDVPSVSATSSSHSRHSGRLCRQRSFAGQARSDLLDI
jgi:hypothetical protein